MRCDSPGGSFVSVILFHRGIEVSVSMTPTCAEANRRAPLDISAGEVGVLRCKGASLEHCFSVESGPGVLRGGHFDDSPKFSSVFGRIVCGKDFHRLKLFDLDSRAENGRTIIEDRSAGDH